MAVEDTFDHLAFTFRRLGLKQCRLETLADNADVSLNGISDIALRNAMLARGVVIKGDLATEYDGNGFTNTVQISFRKFSERAAEIVDLADRPIPAVELISMTEFAEGAVPMSALAHHLRKVGVHFIPGLGYWHKRHFLDENGMIYGSRNGSVQSEAIFQAFKEYGWPMTAIDLVAATKGKVTRQYLTLAVKRPWPDILSAGYGLYIPSGAARRTGYPMSKNVAQAFLDLYPDEVIDSKENTRMYRMCDMLHKLGYGLARRSNTIRDGKQRRMSYFNLNETGRRKLTALVSNKKPDDEF